MDGNFSNFPLGLGMALTMDRNARAGYDDLSETEKEHVILKCKDAKSKNEMDKIINSFAGDDVGDLLRDSEIG
ncbi:MAG: hypothetical protein NC400_09375 [Clostridium sp.]|nr:hypothetical protein [Clostridium sp.]